MKRTSKSGIYLEGSLTRAVEISKNRILFVSCAMAIIFALITYKVFFLTFFGELERSKQKSKTTELNTTKEVPGTRLNVVDRNGILITSSLVTSSLYANPRDMIDPIKAAAKLVTVLPELNQKDLEQKFSSGKSFIWLKRNLHPQKKYEINALGIPGLYFQDEEKRVYPHGNLFSHVVGMVGVDGQGLNGFERYFDENKLKLSKYINNFTTNEIRTSLDVRVQSVVHEELVAQKKKHKAIGACAIIMDVNSGEILAMVSLPDFDPNIPQNVPQKKLFNMATLGSYEMGSTFKAITTAVGLEEGLIEMDSVIDASKNIRIGRFSISDYHGKYRNLTVPEVFIYSSNIGTARIAEQIGIDTMKEYFDKLNLFGKMDYEIIEKSMPLTPQTWSQSTLFTTSYGHGIAVSPMHIISAFSSTINGGIYRNPTLLQQEQTPPGKRIFQKSTSEDMRKLTRLVVVDGTAKFAEAKGYFVGGKTGTAEKLVDGRYVEGKLFSSFVGAFPINDPKYAIVAIFDEPKPTKDTYGYATGGWIAAPVVSRIISKISPILMVKPIADDAPEIQDYKFDYGLKKD